MATGLRALPAPARRWVVTVWVAGLLAVGLGQLADRLLALGPAGPGAPVTLWGSAGWAAGGGSTVVVLVGLSVVSAATEAHTGRVQVVGQTRKELASIWVLAAAVLCSPAAVAVVAAAAYLALAAAERTRRNPVRVGFNVAAYTLAGTLAHLAFVAAGDGSPSEASPRVLLGLLVAALVLTVVSTLVVAEVLYRVDPVHARATVITAAGWPQEAAIACVGLLVAVAMDLHLALALLALPPALLLQRGMLHGQMVEAARTDPKTGLLNHTSWLLLADRALSRDGVRSGLLLDLDHFKAVNDEHGHLVGDEVLVGVAHALGEAVRPVDLLGRFGGEEFVVLLPDADRETAARVGERLREAVASCVVATPGGPLRVTASVGAVTARGPQSPQRLLEAADAALYQAKRAGRDRLAQAPDLDEQEGAGSPEPPAGRRGRSLSGAAAGLWARPGRGRPPGLSPVRAGDRGAPGLPDEGLPG